LDNEQLLGKMVMLQGYNEMANELQKLSLPTLKIDGLFMAHKLSYTTHQSGPFSTAGINGTNMSDGFKSPRSPIANGVKMIDPSMVYINDLSF
jgi:hypothetical protein